MREIYEKLTEEAGASSQDEFSYDVDLDLQVDGLGEGEAATGPEKISLTYSIELDWRSWGLKDINVFPRGKVEFEAEIVDVDDNVVDAITVSFDIGDAELNWVEGHSYVPESLEIRVDRSGKVLSAELNFYFQSQR